MHVARVSINITPLLSLSEKSVLSVSLCDLRASVVNVFWSNFTTETQRIFTEAQRNAFFRQTLRGE